MPLALEALLDTFDAASSYINLDCLHKGTQFSLHMIPAYITAIEGHIFLQHAPM